MMRRLPRCVGFAPWCRTLLWLAPGCFQNFFEPRLAEFLMGKKCYACYRVGLIERQRKGCGRHKAIVSSKAFFLMPTPQVMLAAWCAAPAPSGIFVVVSVQAAASGASTGIFSFQFLYCAAASLARVLTLVELGSYAGILPFTQQLLSRCSHQRCSAVSVPFPAADCGILAVLAAALSVPDFLAVVRFVAVVRTAAVNDGNLSLKGPQLAWAKTGDTTGGRGWGTLRLLSSQQQLRSIGSSLLRISPPVLVSVLAKVIRVKRKMMGLVAGLRVRAGCLDSCKSS